MLERCRSRSPVPARAVVCRVAVGAMFAVVLAAGAAASAEGLSLSIENRSEHPVKVALPRTPAVTVAPGEQPVAVRGGSEGEGVGVTARLWWTSDPRQLCQIQTPWGRTITVTGSREILCRSR